jgi:hypothetical protein
VEKPMSRDFAHGEEGAGYWRPMRFSISERNWEASRKRR